MVGSFDAVVLGGAAYMFHWLKPALLFPGVTAGNSRRVPCGCSAVTRSVPTWWTRPARSATP
jgi:hypothetical protein